MRKRPLEKVFLSYASEQHRDVAAVAVSLRARGYAPFFDRASVLGGESPEAACRAGVETCDLFVFFVSPNSVARGSYTLTELEWAKQRWPDPVGHVMPVLAEDTDLSTVDPYLTQLLNIAHIRGNFAIGVCDLVDALLRPRSALGVDFLRIGRGRSLRSAAANPSRAGDRPERTSSTSPPPVTPSRIPLRPDVSWSAVARRAGTWLLFGSAMALASTFPFRLRESFDAAPAERDMRQSPGAAEVAAPAQSAAAARAPSRPAVTAPLDTPLAPVALSAAAAIASVEPVPLQDSLGALQSASPGLVQNTVSRPTASGASPRQTAPRPRRPSRQTTAAHPEVSSSVVALTPKRDAAPKLEVDWVSTPPLGTDSERRAALARLTEHATMCLEKYPDSAGSKTYYIDLDGDGLVQRLRRDSKTTIGESVAYCIQTSIKLLRFSFKEGRPATLVVAVTLR